MHQMIRTPLLLLLWLLLGRPSQASWDGSHGCPGYKIKDHYYVTDRKDLHFCSYSIKGSPPFPPTQNKLTGYRCVDNRKKIQCSGTIINENYAFWDNVVHNYVDPIPQCPYNIPACQDLDQVCVQDAPRMCNDDGTYICQALDPVQWNGFTDDSPNRTVAQPKEGWCQGIVNSPERYKCPPRHVASFAEVTKFCREGPSRINETHYKCVSHGRTVCQGTIEPNIVTVPSCARTANDCSKAERQRVCKSTLSAREEQFCGAKYRYQQDSMAWTYSGNVLECADRTNGKWCRTELNDTLTASYVHNEYCPKASLNSCHELPQIFIRPAFCFCITNHTTGEEVEFRCHHDGKAEPWCIGHVEAPKFDKYKKLLPKKYPGNAIEETRNHRSSLTSKEESPSSPSLCSGKVCQASMSIGLFVTISIVLITLMIRRTRRGNRKAGDSIVYDRVFHNPQELELQSSSTYRDRPHINII
jgi:hypothetical protein